MDPHINLVFFYHKKNQQWTCGSPLKPIHLTEEEAIEKAEEIRDNLVIGAEIISSFDTLTTFFLNSKEYLAIKIPPSNR